MSSDPTPSAADPTGGSSVPAAAASASPASASPASASPASASASPDSPSHDFDAQKEAHRRIRNDPDYDDWEYGTEPLPHEAWLKRPAADAPAD
jgi:hypothetical protein